MQEKELLKKLGEETLYSAKGHFKACDLRRNFVTYTIWICMFLNVGGLFIESPAGGKIISAIGLVGTIALLIWNEGDGKFYRAKHKQAGEKYLSIHKEIRECFYLSECRSEHVQELSKKVREFDSSEKPDIPGWARRWAKWSIERKDSETNNWFSNEHQ